MRILIWTDAFWPEIGGLELFGMRLAVALRESGHTCEVIAERKAPLAAGPSDYRGIPVYGVSFERAFRSGDVASLRENHEACSREIDRFQPTVIHLNSVLRGVVGFLLQQRRRRLPAVLTLHDNSLARYTRMASSLLEKVDIVTAISASHREIILSCLPQAGPKLRVIPNALPAPPIPPEPLPAPFRLLALGRLVKDKGFDLAIRAFAEMAKTFPEITLTVAGDGRDAESLRQLARDTGFGSRIHFPGYVDQEEVPALINRHSALIMPSRWAEPFGLVALQAAQMGRPIIAAATGALPEIVIHGVTGTSVPNENIPAYREALRRFIENPALLEKMGTQARLHVESYFPYERFLARYEQAYLDAAKTVSENRTLACRAD